MLFCCKIRFIVIYMLFCRETFIVAIYTLSVWTQNFVCGEKMTNIMYGADLSILTLDL